MSDRASPTARVQAELVERTGLRIRDEDVQALASALEERARAAGETLPSYVDRLTGGDARSDDEWQRIVSDLTNNETFFFRDDGQISLLANQLIPELVDKRGAERELTAWSAGCSTGEEAYTLAILLDEVTPGGWDVQVVGSDIDEDALSQARDAVYAGSAFRRTPDEVRDAHFERVPGGWRPGEAVRSSVSFVHHNLVRDPPPRQACGADLILCRNVFIYFSRDAVQRTVGRLADALADGGYLLTGHTELSGVELPGLASRLLPGSVVYEHAAAPPAGSPAPPSPASPLEREASAPEPAPRERGLRETGERPRRRSAPDEARETPLDRAREHLADARPAQALEALEDAGPIREASPETRLLAARARANLGDREEARELVERVLDEDPFAAEAHMLLAWMALEATDLDEARTRLERVIYLDDARLAAYIELAGIYEDQNLPGRAGTMRRAALGLLEDLAPENPVPGYPDTSVAELAEHLRAVLEGSPLDGASR